MNATRLVNSMLLVGMLAAMSGCANFAISCRYDEPSCGAPRGELAGDGIALAHPGRPGVPVMVWPQLPWPECLRREHLRERAHHWRADFGEMLQPEPPAPLKPPHSRFHPLPTQPVFAQRAEYAPPEVVGVDPHAPRLVPPDAPRTENIPVPVPDVIHEPTWRDLPPPRALIAPPEPVKPAAPEPELMLPPSVLPSEKAGDDSRGAVSPTSHLTPNPLRK